MGRDGADQRPGLRADEAEYAPTDTCCGHPTQDQQPAWERRPLTDNIAVGTGDGKVRQAKGHVRPDRAAPRSQVRYQARLQRATPGGLLGQRGEEGYLHEHQPQPCPYGQVGVRGVLYRPRQDNRPQEEADRDDGQQETPNGPLAPFDGESFGQVRVLPLAGHLPRASLAGPSA